MSRRVQHLISSKHRNIGTPVDLDPFHGVRGWHIDLGETRAQVLRDGPPGVKCGMQGLVVKRGGLGRVYLKLDETGTTHQIELRYLKLIPNPERYVWRQFDKNDMITVSRKALCPDGVKIAEKFDQPLLTDAKPVRWGDMSNFLRCHIAWCEACSAMQKN